jgi:hypothetical protein
MFDFTGRTKQLTASLSSFSIGAFMLCGIAQILVTPNYAIAASASARVKIQSASVPTNLIAGEAGKPIVNTSGASEIALAKHLRKKGVKMYGAFWCGHCAHQKELFGQQAFSKIQYIECDPKGTNPQPQKCTQAGVKGFPTWQLPNGQTIPGQAALSDLAKVSGYTGPSNFKNK